MGHQRLGSLPQTRKWLAVVALLRDGADLPRIAAAAAEAAENALARSARDPGLAHAIWLLMQLPLAARSGDYDRQLWTLGLTVRSSPKLYELVGAFSEAIDAHVMAARSRTDLGEMAQLAATETLTTLLDRDLPHLFAATGEEVRQALSKCVTETRFGELAREFAANLTRRCLQYYLDRELSNHVGPGCWFGNIADREEFDRQLDQHCREASRIVQDYSGEWYSRANYREALTEDTAVRFTAVALGKLRAELRRRRDGDD
jgi:hypothetical protein